MAASTTDISFIGSDGVKVEVERGIAECSIFIRDMLNDLGDSGESISIPDTEGSVLRKVFEWCAHHQNDSSTSVPKDDHRIPNIGEWDHKFMAEFDSDMLHEIIRAANFLDIQLLLEIGCRTIADKIKGKTSAEMRRILKIEKDFTPDEEAEIYRENAWVEH